MTEQKIKKGDLVTINIGNYSASANTYIVEGEIKYAKPKAYLLKHPLNLDFYVLKDESELNTTLAILKSEIEKCLYFCKKYEEHLDYEKKAELESLCLYFISKKVLTAHQKRNISNMCGLIASILTNHDVAQAAKVVKDNKHLLDVHHETWYNNNMLYFNEPAKANDSVKKTTVYRIAGFTLAQLEIN